MGVFKRAADALRGETGQGRAQGYLGPIDTERLANELELDRNGREQGNNELPPSAATTLDAHEQQIVQRIEGEWSWHGASLVQELKANASRLLAVTVQTEFARLDLLARDALTKLQSASHRAESDLGPLSDSFRSARKELEDFKIKHRLDRAARTPANRATTIGLLVILISVEASANAIFFAKGSDLGILGGLWIAVCISALNVVVSFATGLFPMRWMNRRNVLVKLVGVCLAAAGVAGIVSMHGFAAHLREVPSTVNESESLSAAVSAMISHPFLLQDLDSYYLFAIGIVWAVVAVAKGYSFDDPYPGYGPTYSRAKSFRERYSGEHHELFDELEEIKDEAVQSIDSGIVRIPLFPQQAAHIRAERQALRQQFRGYEASVQTAVNQLLARYRNANRVARETPPPKYFDELWRLPHSFVHNEYDTGADPAAGESAMNATEALLRLKDMSDAVLKEYGSLLSKYPFPTQMT